MASNRSLSRTRNSSCAMRGCAKKVFTTVTTVDFEVGVCLVSNLCEFHYATQVFCSPERHVGDSHSTSCRYIEYVKVGA